MAEKILIIEDEPSITDNISFVLQSEGFDAIACPTGEQGLAALTKDDVSLIILDIGLPDMNGMEICKKIRKDSNIPIIFLSARISEIDRVVGLEIGADDYIVKPFSARELTARIKAILRRCSPRQEASAKSCGLISFAGISIDSDRKSVSCDGKTLKLSRYEYEILLMLVEHPERIFSRRQIMEKIWEEPEASMERTVDAHIKTLRSKLNDIAPGSDVIVTHRGFGYSAAARQ